MTHTGRRPNPPEAQSLSQSRESTLEPLVRADYAAIEQRILASIAAGSPQTADLRAMTEYLKFAGVVAHRIPEIGETPSDEMIEWLSTCPVDWDGDDSGLAICGELGGPGDYAFQRGDQWGILTRAQVKAMTYGMSFERARAQR